MMLVRDETGKVFNKVSNPAIVFDKESGVYHKIGEYEIMKSYHEAAVVVYQRNEFYKMAEDLILLELPKDQEVLDNVFQISGYIKKFYEEKVESNLN